MTAQTCITIGNFDGVHLGHRALISQAAAVSRERSEHLQLITFWPHPRIIIQGAAHHRPLTTREMRRELLEVLAPGGILELPFTPELAGLGAEEFVVAHLLPLGMKTLVIGHDFSLGRHRQGNVHQLRALAAKHGFDLIQGTPFCVAGMPVSSTRLRHALAVGDVTGAAAMLGRPHMVCGQVTHGQGRGAGLGFPTANVTATEVMLPGVGVYATEVQSGGERWAAVTNVGHNPTFGPNPLTVETFLLDVNVNLYGETIAIAFLERLRDERPFPNSQALMAQIDRDVAAARAIHGNKGC